MVAFVTKDKGLTKEVERDHLLFEARLGMMTSRVLSLLALELIVILELKIFFRS